jgi:hypothetical protein
MGRALFDCDCEVRRDEGAWLAGGSLSVDVSSVRPLGAAAGSDAPRTGISYSRPGVRWGGVVAPRSAWRYCGRADSTAAAGMQVSCTSSGSIRATGLCGNGGGRWRPWSGGRCVGKAKGGNGRKGRGWVGFGSVRNCHEVQVSGVITYTRPSKSGNYKTHISPLIQTTTSFGTPSDACCL